MFTILARFAGETNYVEKEFLSREAAEEWVQGAADAYQKKVETIFPEDRVAFLSPGLSEARDAIEKIGSTGDPGKLEALFEKALRGLGEAAEKNIPESSLAGKLKRVTSSRVEMKRVASRGRTADLDDDGNEIDYEALAWVMAGAGCEMELSLGMSQGVLMDGGFSDIDGDKFNSAVRKVLKEIEGKTGRYKEWIENLGNY